MANYERIIGTCKSCGHDELVNGEKGAYCAWCGWELSSENDPEARRARIEARFERLIIADWSREGDSTPLEHMWGYAEKTESFLESKRAEVKDGE